MSTPSPSDGRVNAAIAILADDITRLDATEVHAIAADGNKLKQCEGPTLLRLAAAYKDRFGVIPVEVVRHAIIKLRQSEHFRKALQGWDKCPCCGARTRGVQSEEDGEDPFDVLR